MSKPPRPPHASQPHLALVERSVTPTEVAAVKEESLRDILTNILNALHRVEEQQKKDGPRLDSLERGQTALVAGQAALTRKLRLYQVASNGATALGASAPSWIPALLDALSKL